MHYDPNDPAQQEWLGRMAAQAHAAGNASIAANPQDLAFALLFDGHVSTPVVHRDGCYICEDPEFAAMGLPLCRPCPACTRRRAVCTACGGRGGMADNTPCTDCLDSGMLGTLGHVPADDDTCDECGEQDGPWNYADDGSILPAALTPQEWEAEQRSTGGA